MAVIIPYGDPNAHGSIANSVSFRRRGAGVIFQKKPVPVQPNTAGQMAQRLAFSNACIDWYSYDAQSKDYFEVRARQLGMTARNLFIHAKLLSLMPSQTPQRINRPLAMQILNTRAVSLQSKSWVCRDTLGGPAYNSLFDNENIFSLLGTASPYRDLFIKISDIDTVTVNYLFRDGCYLKVTVDDIGTIEERIIRIPALTISSGVSQDYYISNDGSAFFDQALTHLAATNNF